MTEAEKPPKIEINRNNLFSRGQRYYEIILECSRKINEHKAQIETITTKVLKEEESKKEHLPSCKS
jgi:uncharacterized metal-binding protein YceD (DUF177 family)